MSVGGANPASVQGHCTPPPHGDDMRYRVLFVGGAPRSGTTVTHALIRTSARTHGYVSECSYFTQLIRAYAIGISTWEQHTYTFFTSRESFREHMAELAWKTLDAMHHHLDYPQVLAHKDPMLTPLFPLVRELLGERTRFVTVLRDPYDVVRSRQEVHFKSGLPFTATEAESVAAEYVRHYAHLDNTELVEFSQVVVYERLNDTSTVKELARFLDLPDLDPGALWRDGAVPESSDPWYSPKYRTPIDLNKRLSPLSDDLKLIVDGICTNLQRRFGYSRISDLVDARQPGEPAPLPEALPIPAAEASAAAVTAPAPPDEIPPEAEDRKRLAAAMELIDAGHTQAGITLLLQLVETHTNCWEAYNELGKHALLNEDADTALPLFQAAAEKAPTPGQAAFNLAGAHERLGNLEQALKHYGEILRHTPGDADSLFAVRRLLGALKEISPVAWARLVSDLRRHD